MCRAYQNRVRTPTKSARMRIRVEPEALETVRSVGFRIVE
jgi:hypothetical protein